MFSVSGTEPSFVCFLSLISSSSDTPLSTKSPPLSPPSLYLHHHPSFTLGLCHPSPPPRPSFLYCLSSFLLYLPSSTSFKKEFPSQGSWQPPALHHHHHHHPPLWDLNRRELWRVSARRHPFEFFHGCSLMGCTCSSFMWAHVCFCVASDGGAGRGSVPVFKENFFSFSCLKLKHRSSFLVFSTTQWQVSL